MDNPMTGRHISHQFDAEMEEVKNRVLAMGGLVERQMDRACEALFDDNSSLAEEVIHADYKVNLMEVEIDEECSRIIARRQPTAFDLRMLIAVIKTITDLERIGDEAENVAKMAQNLTDKGGFGKVMPSIGINHLSTLVKGILHDALDAFARLDADAALVARKQDIRVNQEYDLLMRQLATFMMEDPRKIGAVMDLIWSARALERIGDHASNISEHVVYMVHGRDLRHTTLDQTVSALEGGQE